METDKKLPRARHPFSRVRVHPLLSGESRTHQSHRDEVDINNVIARFDRNGELPNRPQTPQYADVTEFSGDPTDLINRSRATLDTVGAFVSQREAAQAEEERKRQVDLEAEIERLRALEAKVNASE